MSRAAATLPANDTPFDKLYTTDFTAQVWGVSPITVKRLIASGAVKSTLIASSRRIPHSELERGIVEGVATKKKK